MGGAEERLRGGRAPVDEQPAPGAVGQAEPADVDRLVVLADHPPQAQVEGEAAQGAHPRRQPVDLLVPLQRSLPHLRRRAARGVQAVREVGDRVLEALRDGREVRLVARDHRRVGLGGQVVGEVEGARRHGGQGPAPVRSVWPGPVIVRHDGGLAASPPMSYTLVVAEGSFPRLFSWPLLMPAADPRRPGDPQDPLNTVCDQPEDGGPRL